MQSQGSGNTAVGIVFDTGLGNRIDEALAMALLYGLGGKNEARVIALSVSKRRRRFAPHAGFVVVAFTTTTTKGETRSPPWNPHVEIRRPRPEGVAFVQ